MKSCDSCASNDASVASSEVLLRKAAANARLALMTGQTSARDVGAPYGISITLAQAVAAGALPGPRITAAGEWLQFLGTWTHGTATRTVHTLPHAWPGAQPPSR